MKAIYIGVLLLAGTLVKAQSDGNRFNNEEPTFEESSSGTLAEGDAVSTGIGFEDDVDDETVPIDTYIPLLFLVGAALVFMYRKKKGLHQA